MNYIPMDPLTMDELEAEWEQAYLNHVPFDPASIYEGLYLPDQSSIAVRPTHGLRLSGSTWMCYDCQTTWGEKSPAATICWWCGRTWVVPNLPEGHHYVDL